MKPTKFRYVTLAGVKARVTPQSLTDSGMTDADVLALIETSCAKINTWTGQIFQAFPDIVRVKGRGDTLLTHPDVLPFVGLNNIYLLDDRTTGEFKEMDRIIPDMRNFPESHRWHRGTTKPLKCRLLDSDGDVRASGEIQWDVGERTVSMVNLLGGFTKGKNNIEMRGWWGWLEEYKNIGVTLATAIPANTSGLTSVVVDSVVDATSGDFIEIGDTIGIEVQERDGGPWRVENAIVTAMSGTGPYTLTVDPLRQYPFEIPVGANVYCFGATPSALAGVAEYVAGRDLARRISELTGDTDDLLLNEAIDGNLKSEKTDNYSYTLGGARSGSGGGGGGSGSLGKFTGSVEQDLVLRKFKAPAVSVVLI